MTSAEYLYDLRKRLRKLPPQEVNQAMAYYEEYFAEAGPGGEAEVISRLGTPAQVASSIISDYAMKGMHNENEADKKSSPFKTMWIVILAALASPVAIPVAIVLFFVIFALIMVLFSVFLGLFASALAFAVTGLVGVGFGVVALFAQHTDAIALLGISFISASLGLALGLAAIKLCQLSIKAITWIFARILGRKGASDEQRS